MLKGYIKDDLGNCRKVIIDDAGGVLLPVNQIDDEFSFSIAIELLKQGKKIARKGWNGKGMWVTCEKVYTHTDLKVQDIESTFSHPLLIIKNVNGQFATWVPSITDLFAEDWVIVE